MGEEEEEKVENIREKELSSKQSPRQSLREGKGPAIDPNAVKTLHELAMNRQRQASDKRPLSLKNLITESGTSETRQGQEGSELRTSENEMMSSTNRL